MKRIYLASSSKGDRELLSIVAQELAHRGHFVFAPCLAFIGREIPEIRPQILQVCFTTVIQWAEALVILDEGIPSIGCENESDIARVRGIPIYYAYKESLGADINRLSLI